MKLLLIRPILTLKSRSREGAWIEILSLHHLPRPNDVAPARERGLKCSLQLHQPNFELTVAPARERGLKWTFCLAALRPQRVAPARERGLKSQHRLYVLQQ